MGLRRKTPDATFDHLIYEPETVKSCCWGDAFHRSHEVPEGVPETKLGVLYLFKNVIEMADNCPVLLKLLHNLIAKFVVVILVVPRSVLTTPPDKVFPKGDILDQIKDQRPA